MWNTIYIKGSNNKFKDKIRKQLYKSDLVAGEDYIEGTHHQQYMVYWIKPELEVRQFKLAIGAKYIWKYRIQIGDQLEDIFPKKEEGSGFTEKELKLIKKFKSK